MDDLGEGFNDGRKNLVEQFRPEDRRNPQDEFCTPSVQNLASNKFSPSVGKNYAGSFNQLG